MGSFGWMPSAQSPLAVERLLAFGLRFPREAQGATLFDCMSSLHSNSITGSTWLVAYRWNGDYHEYSV